MISPNGLNGTHLICESDHPIIDVTPLKPRPRWDNQLAPVTWSMSYIDSSEISHSVTVRADGVEQALELIKPIVAGIRKAKELAKKDSPEQPETQEEKVMCKIHGAQMERRVSKRTKGHYFCHRIGNDLCFGKAK